MAEIINATKDFADFKNKRTVKVAEKRRHYTTSKVVIHVGDSNVQASELRGVQVEAGFPETGRSGQVTDLIVE